jgi:hypothetical protein
MTLPRWEPRVMVLSRDVAAADDEGAAALADH